MKPQREAFTHIAADMTKARQALLDSPHPDTLVNLRLLALIGSAKGEAATQVLSLAQREKAGALYAAEAPTETRQ